MVTAAALCVCLYMPLAETPQPEQAASDMAIAMLESVTRSVHESDESDLLARVAVALACLHRVDDALSSVRQIQIPEIRDCTLKAIAIPLARDGEIGKAFDLAREASDPHAVMCDIALSLTDAIQLDRAIEQAQQIVDRQSRGIILVHVARAHARNRNPVAFTRVMALATPLINRDSTRHDSMLAIALAYAANGEPEEAGRIAQQYQSETVDLSELDFVHSEIAIELARTGTYEAALATASRLSNDFDRDQLITRIAQIRLEAGDEAGTLEMVLAEPPGESLWREETLLSLSEAHANRGQVSEALKWAEKIDLRALRARALFRVAVGYSSAKNTDLCNQVLDRALKDIAAVENHGEQAELLATLALMEMQCGYRDRAAARVLEADRLARQIDYSKSALNFEKCLIVIAEAQFRLGDSIGARATLQFAWDVHLRLHQAGRLQGQAALNAYCLLAAKFVEVNDTDTALRNAELVQGDGIHQAVFETIAHIEARRGKLEDVRAWIDKLVPATSKLSVLVSAVEGALVPDSCECSRTFKHYWHESDLVQ